MLHAERPRLPTPKNVPDRAVFNSRDLLLAIAPPPEAHWIPLSDWPSWLIPAYRSGGHGPELRLLEEDDEEG